MRTSLDSHARARGLSLRRLAVIACLCLLPAGTGVLAQGRKDGADVDVRLRERSRALEAAHAEVRAAQQALEEAHRRQLAGEEPLPGERTGNVGGKSRLNEAYFARQDQLEQAVQQAEQRLDRAHAGVNDLR